MGPWPQEDVGEALRPGGSGQQEGAAGPRHWHPCRTGLSWWLTQAERGETPSHQAGPIPGHPCALPELANHRRKWPRHQWRLKRVSGTARAVRRCVLCSVGALVSCSPCNKMPHTGGLQTMERWPLPVLSPEVGSQLRAGLAPSGGPESLGPWLLDASLHLHTVCSVSSPFLALSWGLGPTPVRHGLTLGSDLNYIGRDPLPTSLS